MNKLNSNSEVKSELHKEYKLIISITVLFLIICFALSFVVTIKRRVVLENSFIKTVPEPVLFYAGKDIDIKNYNVRDGDVVKKGDSIYNAINPSLEEDESILLQQIKRDNTKINAMNKYIDNVYERMKIEKNYENFKFNKNESELKNIDSILKEHRDDYDFFSQSYREQMNFVDKVSNHNNYYLSKKDIIKYKMELFSSRSKLINLESDILNLEKRKYSLDDEQNRYIIGATKYKELDMEFNQLRGELFVLISELNVKNTRMENIRNAKLRIEGIAKIDGKIEFNNINGIRPKQVKKGELVFTIYPDGNHFIAKGVVSEKHIRKIKIGQSVELKMDAYDYLKHGAIKGKVEAIFGVKNGTAEIVINLVDKRDFDLEFGNSIKAFIILDEVNLYEYIYEIAFPYVA
ncbi:HlyD family efflux transporter periplasmic adaptor subunit [Xenorhabdus budapestensis]|uniref:HlyD family efflux transporter periplasmic adaptor subunit n=1 Tax=Xenorhabdus budapestensis TaxID=290110 RepID=UPI003A84A7DA